MKKKIKWPDKINIGTFVHYIKGCLGQFKVSTDVSIKKVERK